MIRLASECQRIEREYNVHMNVGYNQILRRIVEVLNTNLTEGDRMRQLFTFLLR